MESESTTQMAFAFQQKDLNLGFVCLLVLLPSFLDRLSTHRTEQIATFPRSYSKGLIELGNKKRVLDPLTDPS